SPGGPPTSSSWIRRSTRPARTCSTASTRATSPASAWSSSTASCAASAAATPRRRRRWRRWWRRAGRRCARRDDLEALSDDALIDAAVEYVCRRVGSDAENRLELLNSLPEGLQAFFAVWLVDAEVKNGGFSQYFWNRGDSGAGVAVFGFRLLGADD